MACMAAIRIGFLIPFTGAVRTVSDIQASQLEHCLLPAKSNGAAFTVRSAAGPERVVFSFDSTRIGDDECLQTCKATKVYEWGSKACAEVFPGSVSISNETGQSGLQWNLCCLLTHVPSRPDPILAEEFPCRPGQGEGWKSYGHGPENNFNACALRCKLDPHCAGIDFTKKSKTDACRLYPPNKPKDQDDTGWDDRVYCKKKNYGQEPPAPPAPPKPAEDLISAPYSCRAGQGEGWKSWGRQAYNAKEDCAKHCQSTKGCIGFDVTALPHQDACRLYSPNKVKKEGDVGWHDRIYCFLVEVASVEIASAKPLTLMEIKATAPAQQIFQGLVGRFSLAELGTAIQSDDWQAPGSLMSSVMKSLEARDMKISAWRDGASFSSPVQGKVRAIDYKLPLAIPLPMTPSEIRTTSTWHVAVTDDKVVLESITSSTDVPCGEAFNILVCDTFTHESGQTTLVRTIGFEWFDSCFLKSAIQPTMSANLVSGAKALQRSIGDWSTTQASP